MSDTTKAALETALNDHLTAEDMLRPGEIVTDWMILAASLPPERTDDEDAIYTVVTAEHMMSHHSLGLAAWYLHDRHNDVRRD
jgi:hypothetical protein